MKIDTFFVIMIFICRDSLYTKISNFATEESIQFILNCLFSCYFAKNYQTNNMFKVHHSKALETRRNAVLKQMKDDSNK